jgi:hypothetical protein
MLKNMLKKEFQYYLDNQEELVNKYLAKFLVIKNQEIVGVYDTKQEAYDEATSKYELGTFLIQHCLPGSLSHTQTFHSQVIFNQVAL